ncbi:hypothetical protein DSM03_102341 [Leeuwenhoekiella aestuarii]|uniref:Uncharacterized protein n=1 Tax=Leeuwenhoekiella aestuarii TaxID=2249426 RepID=A0A4Q0NV79_9FLAO|nr:hypothetical protein DSM04_103317 [Leeuwenhoekiella aestuarii]RXG17465.1 hypothetical protein DSM03_102341 [Leeuwenhoekiella aestuarii]
MFSDFFYFNKSTKILTIVLVILLKRMSTFAKLNTLKWLIS